MLCPPLDLSGQCFAFLALLRTSSQTPTTMPATATQTFAQADQLSDQLATFRILGSAAVQAAPDSYKYKRFLPEWTTSFKLPPLEPFEHVDPDHKALSDAEPLSFLEGATVRHLTPDFGSEILSGADLTKLDSRERSQLALFVAQRGVVVFRQQQKFVDADPEWWIK